MLYALTGFLVEVCYKNGDQKVQEIRPMAQMDYLDPYLELIYPSE